MKKEIKVTTQKQMHDIMKQATKDFKKKKSYRNIKFSTIHDDTNSIVNQLGKSVNTTIIC